MTFRCGKLSNRLIGYDFECDEIRWERFRDLSSLIAFAMLLVKWNFNHILGIQGQRKFYICIYPFIELRIFYVFIYKYINQFQILQLMPMYLANHLLRLDGEKIVGIRPTSKSHEGCVESKRYTYKHSSSVCLRISFLILTGRKGIISSKN